MTGAPRVCIMIPTYNQAPFISKAIESAVAQDYPNVEIVVADDNSTDNTAEVVQSFTGPGNISYRKNDHNLGRVGNYRKCLNEYTDAEWVINLDGDDYYTNIRFISQAMAAIQSSGQENTIFYQGVHLARHYGPEPVQGGIMDKGELVISTTDYFFTFFDRHRFSHMSTLYNRRLALDYFYQKDILSADIYSLLSLCLRLGDKKAVISENISGVWVDHGRNTSRTINFWKHWNNYRLYIQLYLLAGKMGYDKIRCFKWLLRSAYNYWVGYVLKCIAIMKRSV